jgi:preprotein translocase subunit SecG
VVAAVVVVLLLLVGAGVAVVVVVLVLYLRKRDKSLGGCFEGRRSRLFGIGELYIILFILYTEAL